MARTSLLQDGRRPPLRQLVYAVVLFAAVVGLPQGAMAQDLQAIRAAGTGIAVASTDATVAFRPQSDFSLDLQFGSAHVVAVDEVIESAVHVGPSTSSAANTGDRRDESPSDATAGSVAAATATDGDAVAIVVPLDGSPSQARASTSGAFSVGSVGEQKLESSHAVSSAAVNQQTFAYYEYTAPASLEWSTTAATDLQVRGDFELYLWGIPFQLTVGGASSSHATGFASEPDPSTGGLTTDDHHRYVRFLVHDGTLDLSSADGAVSLFGASMDAQPSELTFQSADGSGPADGGSFTADGGPVTATRGDYHLVYKPGGMGIDVTQAPARASGPYVQFTPTPWSKQPWFAPLLGLSMAMVGLTASAYAYPTIHGTRHLRYMEDLTGTPRALGWRKSRAEGYALMAAAAEDAGHMRRAALWMALAIRFDPHDPAKRLDLGVFQAARGRHQAALRHFAAAHTGFLEVGDSEDMAHNAYEAARAASIVRDQDQALDWLRIAVQADPAIAAQIGLDPAFASLRETSDYAAMTRV